jgi:general secretion pathway protein D
MRRLAIFLALLACASASAQTIEEKKAETLHKRDGEGIEGGVSAVNRTLALLRQNLDGYYAEALQLHRREAPEGEYHDLLSKINAVKADMLALEGRWRDVAVTDAKSGEEGYGLWDQEETTLTQLVMEYGAMDFLYIVPPEMANVKLHMHSNIPIPRESWSEMLEIILAHSGIGVKKLNPYARQLYSLKLDPAAVQVIASRPEELRLIPQNTRLFYIFSPPVEQVKGVFQFFERFSDAKQTFVYQVGSKVAVVAYKEEIEKLSTLYDTVWTDGRGKISKVVPVSKMGVKEMEKVLLSFFGDNMEKGKTPFGKMDNDSLALFSLEQSGALVLVGQPEVVERAEKIVQSTEEQLQDPSEMTVYLYACRHSDPADLAKLLEKVYASLLTTSPEGRESMEVSTLTQGGGLQTPDGYSPTPPLVVTPPPLKPGISTQVQVEEGTDHFIPDPKTGSLLMAVRKDVLPKIKELLRKLDVPKKMVQIEVLLFEKALHTENAFGLNLLKLGSNRNGLSYTSLFAPTGRGVLQFLLHGGGDKHWPRFDLAYNFLMTQEDVQLNAAPSVITVNQTPATISIVDEISINNGAAPVDTNKGIAFEKSFSRAQYGITIVLTPTVHLPDAEGEESNGFVTLQTNITFDTPLPSADERPLVNRRHIENEVRVVDGQTVILGGLRKKTMQDKEEKIPFLGELPGIGKLFGSTNLTDTSTEMFFFITPTIILDPEEQLERFRTEELKKRPGDIPEFLEKVAEARDKERRRFFEQSMKLIMGRNYYDA